MCGEDSYFLVLDIWHCVLIVLPRRKKLYHWLIRQWAWSLGFGVWSLEFGAHLMNILALFPNDESTHQRVSEPRQILTLPAFQSYQMKLEEILLKRSEGTCELCGAVSPLKMYEVAPQQGGAEERTIVICDACRAQIERKEELDGGRWSFLTASMWSEVPGVQIVSWRMLQRLRGESWAADALDMMSLDDDMLAWAKA